MFSGKLGSVRRQEDRTNRLLKVRDRIEFRNEDSKHWKIKKEKRIADEKRDMYTSQVRKAFVRWRVLQKCLQQDHDAKPEQEEGNLYGHYGGRPVNSYEPEIEQFLDYNQPEKRKRRKMDSLMTDGLRNGQILDTDITLDKITEYFQEQWGVGYKDGKRVEKSKQIDENERHRRRSTMNENDTGHTRLPKINTKSKTFLVTAQRGEDSFRDKSSDSLPLKVDTRNESKHSLKRKRLEKLTQKIECSKPNCSGYLGRSFLQVLPRIEQSPPVSA